jgi:alkylhydroperoxidase/carboxymuconolactone decarboxylase family protein YurZ
MLAKEGKQADFLHVLLDGAVELFAEMDEQQTTITVLRPVTAFILPAVVAGLPCLASARNDTMDDSDELPSGAGNVARTYPAIWQAYSALGTACTDSGPIDPRTARLLKLALAIGASSEGAVHSHSRRAIREGISKAELNKLRCLQFPQSAFRKRSRA